ncbi:YihY family inner membrane protein [Alphaproteobacteria bacterium GH1-50]|uniref:YihY family inner membrane protein n=1 Tax=Kangsaoukella pontilimi TaxID=2691042 RepID=A0A7C9J1P0_9RHOB|nr:YihY/virulence factor BrkB family protein [Kangsaoukella pontilimi]MXQ06961.1 YihY family inner membrane protein [Kangsaoukella pontilimi]
MSSVDPTEEEARGRDAARPSHIPWRGWQDIIRRVVKRTITSQIGLIAAGVAFYSLLAVLPAIAALMALAGLFTDPGAVVIQLQGVAALLPEEAAQILLDQANEVAGADDEGLSLTLAFGVGFAIYLLTRATTSLIHGLNIVFEEAESRSFFRFWGMIIMMTGALLFGGLLLLLLLVGLPTLLNFIPLDIETEATIRTARWGFIAVVFVAGLSMLYRWGPSRRRARWRWLTPGAVAASALWFIGSIGFAIYVANFAHYNETFGSLGGVIVLLTWLWLSAFIVLLGALFDAEIEHQTARDSTIGPDRPMGERGATKADTLGKTYD